MAKLDQRAAEARNFRCCVDLMMSRFAMPKRFLRILLYAFAFVGVAVPLGGIAFIGLALVGF
jgi:hypothetical protein